MRFAFIDKSFEPGLHIYFVSSHVRWDLDSGLGCSLNTISSEVSTLFIGTCSFADKVLVEPGERDVGFATRPGSFAMDVIAVEILIHNYDRAVSHRTKEGELSAEVTILRNFGLN